MQANEILRFRFQGFPINLTLLLRADSPLRIPFRAVAGLGPAGEVGDMISLGGDAAPITVALRLTDRRMSVYVIGVTGVFGRWSGLCSCGCCVCCCCCSCSDSGLPCCGSSSTRCTMAGDMTEFLLFDVVAKDVSNFGMAVCGELRLGLLRRRAKLNDRVTPLSSVVGVRGVLTGWVSPSRLSSALGMSRL
jgi:hypothetical protein